GFKIPLLKMQNLCARNWYANICNESQGIQKDKTSIQYQVIEKLKKEKYWMIFDDDGSNEIADVIAIMNDNKCIRIEFYHLKYSQEPTPGARIKDLYEVCGQVIKGCKWVGEFDLIIDRLKHRERSRLNSKQ